MIKRGSKVVCAMSGGVDSSVSAYLLKKKGFEVTGVYMNNWDTVEEGDSLCSQSKDYLDAQLACEKLNIKLDVLDCVKTFWNSVFQNMIESYKEGVTIVPDVLCNKLIKFDELHQFAIEKHDAVAIATGHYAKNSLGNYLELSSGKNNNAKLLRSADPIKDQTYFLALLKSHQLKRAMFPLGDYMKSDVKTLACQIGLDKIAHKQESMGVCFIGKKKNFNHFLANYLEPKKGDIVEIETNKIIGSHDGCHNYTIGKKVKISPDVFQCHEGLFVTKVNAAENIVYVCQGSRHSSLFSREMLVNNLSLINDNAKIEDLKNVKCLIQRNQPPVSCQLQKEDNNVYKISLQTCFKAVGNGQFCVLYNHNECLGGGQIQSASTLYVPT
uniref:tRNA-5-taurinomethyluridine 2-sulfurtransferase n=1 Tax=Rhabditophanes sp. KR3021 TaxID=114890 RepID=A0AC35UIR5_9BILA